MPRNEALAEQSMFEVIAVEVRKLKEELERIMGGKLEHTITYEELGKILINAQHSVRLLKKITVKEACSDRDRLLHFLEDSSFVEAVKTVLQNPNYPYIT